MAETIPVLTSRELTHTSLSGGVKYYPESLVIAQEQDVCVCVCFDRSLSLTLVIFYINEIVLVINIAEHKESPTVLCDKHKFMILCFCSAR